MTPSELLPKDEDVVLSCVFISDADKRAAVLALYALLETVRGAAARVSEPLMGEIRMRWWYEAMEEIRDGKPVRYHPLTEALQDVTRTYGLSAQSLMDMIEGQMPLLDKGPLTVKDALSCVDRGEGIVTQLAAAILGEAGDLAGPARLYGMAHLKARRGLSDAGDTELAHLRRDAAGIYPARLMPLALPAVLAADVWLNRPRGPLAKRLKLFWSFVTGRL